VAEGGGDRAGGEGGDRGPAEGAREARRLVAHRLAHHLIEPQDHRRIAILRARGFPDAGRGQLELKHVEEELPRRVLWLEGGRERDRVAGLSLAKALLDLGDETRFVPVFAVCVKEDGERDGVDEERQGRSGRDERREHRVRTLARKACTQHLRGVPSPRLTTRAWRPHSQSSGQMTMANFERAILGVVLLVGCSGELSGAADGGTDAGMADATVRPDAGDPLSCRDGVQGETETGVDCGGGICPRCADDAACNLGGDCISLYCRGGVCQALPSCGNGSRDGRETDVDCGGPLCNPCPADRECNAPLDCESLLCVAGGCRAAAGTCSDGMMNGSETAADCGGPECGACADGSACVAATDCRSGMCGGGSTCCGDTAGMSFDVPDTNEDGSCIYNLAGFRAKWGAAPGEYTSTQEIPLDDLGLTCVYLGTMGPCAPVIRCFYRLSGLSAGLTYFTVTAYNTSGVESMPAIEATKTIVPCP